MYPSLPSLRWPRGSRTFLLVHLHSGQRMLMWQRQRQCVNVALPAAEVGVSPTALVPRPWGKRQEKEPSKLQRWANGVPSISCCTAEQDGGEQVVRTLNWCRPTAWKMKNNSLTLFLFICTYASVWMCATCVQEAEKGVIFPRAGIIGGCEPPYVGARNQTPVLWRAGSALGHCDSPMKKCRDFRCALPLLA